MKTKNVSPVVWTLLCFTALFSGVFLIPASMHYALRLWAFLVFLFPFWWNTARNNLRSTFDKKEWPITLCCSVALFVMYLLMRSRSFFLFLIAAFPYIFYVCLVGIFSGNKDVEDRKLVRAISGIGTLGFTIALSRVIPENKLQIGIAFLFLLWIIVIFLDFILVRFPGGKKNVFNPFERGGRATAFFALWVLLYTVMRKNYNELTGVLGSETWQSGLLVFLFLAIFFYSLYVTLYGLALPRSAQVGIVSGMILLTTFSVSLLGNLSTGLSEIIGVALSVQMFDKPYRDYKCVYSNTTTSPETLTGEDNADGKFINDSVRFAHAIRAESKLRYWKVLPSADINLVTDQSSHWNSLIETPIPDNEIMADEFLFLGWYHLRWGNLPAAAEYASYAGSFKADKNELKYLLAEIAIRNGDFKLGQKLLKNVCVFYSIGTNSFLGSGNTVIGALPLYPVLRLLSISLPYSQKAFNRLNYLPYPGPSTESGLPKSAGADVRSAAAAALDSVPNLKKSTPDVRARWTAIATRLIADARAENDVVEVEHLKKQLERIQGSAR